MRSRDRFILVVGLAFVSLLAWQASQPIYVNQRPEIEDPRVTVSLYCQDSDGARFWFAWTAEDSETSAQLLARAKSEASSNGWSILDPPSTPE